MSLQHHNNSLQKEQVSFKLLAHPTKAITAVRFAQRATWYDIVQLIPARIDGLLHSYRAFHSCDGASEMPHMVANIAVKVQGSQ